MIRLVLDTNIIVSALLNPQGTPARVFLSSFFERDTRLCVTSEIYAEYEEVLLRPRLHRGNKEIEATLKLVRDRGIWVRPAEKLTVCNDPDDNVFLECAQFADAHFLITGNTRHFPARWLNTRIVTARQFLDEIM